MWKLRETLFLPRDENGGDTSKKYNEQTANLFLFWFYICCIFSYNVLLLF